MSKHSPLSSRSWLPLLINMAFVTIVILIFNAVIVLPHPQRTLQHLHPQYKLASSHTPTSEPFSSVLMKRGFVQEDAPLDASSENSVVLEKVGNETLTEEGSEAEHRAEDLMSSLTSGVRNALRNGQQRLLRAIGRFDQGATEAQLALQNRTTALVLEGQKTFARAYHKTPQSVNKLIQRIGTVRRADGGSGGGVLSQLNNVVHTWRENRRKLYDVLEEHQYDVHNVLQNAWSTVNRHLGVPELPRMELGWY